MEESSYLELLSITDAAVKALNKSARSNSLASSRSSHSGQGSARQRSDGTKSDNPESGARQDRGSPDSGICKTYTAADSQHQKVTDCFKDEVIPLDRSSDESTTASDVLIKSTLADPADQSILEVMQNASSISKCSKSSLGADNFNSSGPQKVKISTKRLREIKSPFENDQKGPKNNTENIPPALSSKNENDKNNSVKTKKFSPEATNRNYVKNEMEKPKVPRDLIQTLPFESGDETDTSEKSKTVQAKKVTSNLPVPDQNQISRSPRFPGDTIDRKYMDRNINDNTSSRKNNVGDDNISKKIVTSGQLKSFQNKRSEIGKTGKSDTEFMKTSPRFPGDRVSKSTTKDVKDTEVSPPLIDGSVDDWEHKKKLNDSIDLIPSKDTVLERIVTISAQNSMSSSSDISDHVITVPERIVTISAQNSVSASDISDAGTVEEEKIPPKLPVRFHQFTKANGVNLQQGRPVEGVDEPDKQKQSKDVQISSYCLSDKEKLVKQSFFKRHEHTGPVKRVVQPKFVNRDKSIKKEEAKDSGEGGGQQPSSNTDVLTAAVAASAAAQYDLETKMAEILDKIQELRGKEGKVQDNEIVKELEKQSAMHAQRYEHLEQMQLEMKAKLLSLSRSSRQSRSPSPTSFRNRSFSPPRKSEIQNTHRKAFTRGILEEILASAESPRRGIPAPIVQTRSDGSMYIPHNGPKSPNVKKAEVLERELSEIKQQMNDLVSEIEQGKTKQEKTKTVLQEKQVESRNITAEELLGPSPLDPYLVPPVPSGASPYKSVTELSHSSVNAPVLSGFSAAAQREIAEELQRNPPKNPFYPIGAPPSVSTKAYNKGPGVRGGTGAKIDTGLKRGRAPVQPSTVRNVPANKENKPMVYKKPVKKPGRSAFEDEEYMTRVYGKAPYQSKRTTVKDPYLHFQNTAKYKAPRPAAVLDIKGREVKSAKTQTASGVRKFYFSPTSGSYIPVSGDTTAAPIPGQLIPMAVPLGGPRFEGGLTVPVTWPEPSGPLTSTPAAVTAAKNVAMVTIPTEDDLTEKPAPELTKQVLPAVDIDTDVSEMSEFQQEAQHEISDEDISPESAPGLALPGYQPPSPPPTVEVVSDFPPKNIPPVLASDVIAEDIRRRDALQNRAVEWVEQELMARIIMETYPLKKEEPQEMPHVIPDESVASEPEEDQEQAMFVMDSIGRAGLQIFVDAGQPVDNNLVNALIREVLIEKVSSMLGQRPGEESARSNDEGLTHKIAAAASGATDYVVIKEDTTKEEPDYYRTRTPQPTPKSSPVISPVRVPSPPVTPNMSPRQPRQYESQPVYVPEQSQVESEPESASLDLSEELRRIAGKMVVEQVSRPVEQVHDVYTPIGSPEPELPEEEQPLTPPMVTPRKEVIVEEKVIEVKVPEAASQEIKPKLKVPAEVEIKPTSPQPWADPSSPMPEENPNFKDTSDDISVKEQQKHELSLSQTQEVDIPPAKETQTTPPPTFRKTPSPVPTESESYSEPSSVSDSINQSVSEGQWLINKSEGEVANFAFSEDAKQRMRIQNKPDISTTSTLWEASEIEDEASEFPVSEGEFQYKPSVAPDKDPVLVMLSRLQHQPISYGQYNMPSNQVHDMLSTNGKSTGEVSMFGGTAKSMGEVGGRDVTGRSYGEVRFVEPRSRPERSLKQSRESDDYSRQSRQKSPLRMTDLRTEEADLIPVRDASIEKVVKEKTRTPTKPITVTAGGAPSGGRNSPIKSALRKPPQATKSTGLPDRSESLKQTRVVNVRSSDGNINDSQENAKSMEGLRTTSDQGTRTFTPDQMNLDDLIASGYLLQNLSQSGEMGQSGGQSLTLDNSVRDSMNSRDMSPTRLTRERKSLGLTYSFESESGDTFSENELRKMAGMGTETGTLKMSVTIPSTALSEEESEVLSEIEITNGNTMFILSMDILFSDL
ncbi:hypothetical protein KUTeg_013191 [Tegillarca granosa]|uniref:Uncharacterized protein n=1 Tax=Tegillarca granosa TaxID=220873 RepID=A0ABQ9ESZ9_TEGGR|nr:hypothetical protein KUTeg_013191 [Tegillarca granosa]